MMMSRDSIGRLRPKQAEKVRADYEKQLELQRKYLTHLKGRKAKLIKKLDKEIAEVEADIQGSKSVIEAIDECHFNTIERDLRDIDICL